MNCIILDDEPYAHEVLQHYIAQTPGMVLKASFRNAVHAFEFLGQHPVDLLFLDIEMPLVNGLQFLKALPAAPKTIFTTAYKQYAFEGYELGVIDYLLKPFSYERFRKAIEKLEIRAADPAMSQLLIKDKTGFLNLNQQDILYIEGCGDYVKITSQNEVHIIYHTLKGILEKLNPMYFVQAHRSYIVNRHHVQRIQLDTLLMTGQVLIPIGQSYKKSLIQELNKTI